MRHISTKNTLPAKLTPIASAIVLSLTTLSTFSHAAMTQDTPAVDAQNSGIEVIEVTSTKRTTSLMETGQAVSAFSSEAIKKLGIDGAEDLAQFTPALVITNNKISIRGIGRPNNALGSDPGVGIYTDGVYNTENGVFNYCNMCDVERIEVLRGPQGTLYGRNAVGGAINIISKAPQEDFGGYVSAEVGNYNLQTLQGQVTGALSDRFSAIATFSQAQRDGFQENINNGEQLDARDHTYGSITVKADWSDNWVSTFRYMHSQRDGTPDNGYNFDEYNTTTSGGALPGMFAASNALNHFDGYTGTNPALQDRSKVNIDHMPTLDSGVDRFIFTNTLSLGSMELKYTLGAYEYTFDKQTDADQAVASSMNIDAGRLVANSLGMANLNAFGLAGVPLGTGSDMLANVNQTGDSISQELQLVSNFDGNINFIAGLYYYNSVESQYSDFVETGFGLMEGDVIARNTGGAINTGAIADLSISSTIPGVPPGVPVLGLGPMSLYQYYATLANIGAGLPGMAPFELASNYAGGGFLYYGQNDLETTAIAAYGQIEYDVTEDLMITAGLRYSDDEKIGKDDVFAYLSTPKTQHNVENDWSKVTWRLQADWDMDDTTHLYGYVATGYRSGGFNLGAATVNDVATVAPEELTAYEVGYKKVMFDNRVHLSAAAYYYDYTDLQVMTTLTEGGFTTVGFKNAAAASVTGAELEINAMLTSDTQATMSYSLTNAEYDEYNSIDSTACAILANNNPTAPECQSQDLSGNKLNLSPDSKFSLAVKHYFDIGEKGELSATLAYSYVGEQFDRAFNYAPWDKVDAYDRTDARITWISPQDSWNVELWVKNASDDRQTLRTDVPSTVTRLSTGEVTQPMTYGLNVTYNFGL